MITVQELELISYCLINTVSLGLLTWSQVPLNGQSFQVNPSWCLTRWREGTEDSSNKAGIVSSRLQKDVSAWPVRRKWGKKPGLHESWDKPRVSLDDPTRKAGSVHHRKGQGQKLSLGQCVLGGSEQASVQSPAKWGLHLLFTKG